MIMGILNITPDSFSDGGSYADPAEAVVRALEMLEEGVDIIDIGGESTRPGAVEISAAEELHRVLPVIDALRTRSDIPISIDTRHAAVAEAAITSGADMINDVSALRHDPHMMDVASRSGVPVVLMHMQGSPETMQAGPAYQDLIEDLVSFFKERIADCRDHGITRLVLDPGIGFGKTTDHNLVLLRELPRFEELEYPLLVGTSRKYFIGAVTGAAVGDRLPGSIASNVIAYLNGARILRVHDVRETRDAIAIAAAITQAEVQTNAL